MNIKELMGKQKKLDDMICNKFKVDIEPFKSNIQMACIVEIGEFANEIEHFKHWKKNKRNDRDKQVDEFADVMHFVLSICNLNGEEPKEDLTLDKLVMVIESRVKDLSDFERGQMLNAYFLSLTNEVLGSNGFMALLALVNIGILMNMTTDDMIKAYLTKNEINYKRQEANY